MKYNIYSVRDICNGFSVPVCDFNDKSASLGLAVGKVAQAGGNLLFGD